MEKLEKTLTKVQKEIILENFGEISVKEISKLSNVKERSIRKFLQNRGLKLTKEQKRRVKAGKNIKYERNRNFFKERTNASIYWAGFLAADGYVQGNRIRLKLKWSDKEHVEKFKNDIEYTGVIKKDCSKRLDKIHCGALIYISSLELVTDLKNMYNITENKSLTLIPPNELNTEEKDLFILGYFDGDGTVYQKGKYLCCKFYGTKSMNLWIKDRMDELRGKNSGSIFQKENIWCFELNPSSTNLFMEHFSKLNSPRLERKWNSYENGNTS